MIYQITGKLVKKGKNSLIVEVNGILYTINTPETVAKRFQANDLEVKLVIYHYFNIEKNKGLPVLIGFSDELERDFFEKFISVSGVGPKAALKAFNKPVALMAKAIEEGDIGFLKTLTGIGQQKAKQIVAHLQGKVGRFALIKEGDIKAGPDRKEIVNEAKEILKRLQYKAKETEDMIDRALKNSAEFENVEELLNEIYRQKK